MIHDNRIGQWPRGFVINKAWLVAGTIGLCTFVLLFIWLLKVSAPKRQIEKPEVMINQHAAFEMIKQMEGAQQTGKPEVKKLKVALEKENAKAVKPVAAVLLDKLGDELDEHFQSGAQAAISVYQQSMAPSTESPLSFKVPKGDLPKIDLPNDIGLGQGLPNDYKQQNGQQDKRAFINQVSHSGKTSLANYQHDLPFYSLKAGSVIPIVLQTQINSDLPGMVSAKVRRGVFDTVTGEQLLIPQGTTVIGQYDSEVVFGQKRVLMTWQKLIFPNGDSFDIGSQPGIDGLGAAGVSDKVNQHLGRTFGSSALFSLLSAGSSLAGSHDKDDTSVQASMSDALGQQLSQTGMGLLAKNMNIQPTLVVRAGTRFNVMLNDDLVFPHAYAVR